MLGGHLLESVSRMTTKTKVLGSITTAIRRVTTKAALTNYIINTFTEIIFLKLIYRGVSVGLLSGISSLSLWSTASVRFHE